MKTKQAAAQQQAKANGPQQQPAQNLKKAVERLAAPGHGSRLAIVRQLMEAGAEGLSAGVISERLGLAPPTLSFHLAHLSRVGLASARQQGRFIFYSADFRAMDELVAFLGDNCDRGKQRAGSRAMHAPAH